MKADNLTFLIVISCGLIIALGSYLATQFTTFEDSEIWIYRGLWISELAGFFMLILNGTFIKTRFFKILNGAAALIIVGALFKIMHWQYADLLLTMGLIGTILIYFLSFLKKPLKKRLDFLKLTWVIVAFAIAILRFAHLIGEEYQVLSSTLIWLAIIDYLKMQKEKGRLFS